MSWRRFGRDENGNMAVLFAFGFVISIMVSAVAVDAAALYHERRQMQAGVDLAAISAAADPSRAAEIARSVLSAARLLAPDSTEGLVVSAGHYDPSRPLASGRFRAGQAPYNAVQVTLHRPGTLYFAQNFSANPTIGASGIAAIAPEISFSLGSRVASLNGGIANAVLSRLLGTTVSLSVLDYNALASARVDALDFLDALAIRLNVEAGTYDDLLALDAGSGTMAAALAGLVNGTARTALNTLSLSGHGNSVSLGKLFALGKLGALQLGSGGAVAGLSLSALEVLSATAALADGEHFVSLNLGLAVPGLTSLRLDLAIGEPPQGSGWFALGPVGTIVRTAQLRLRLRADLLGGVLLLGAGVKLPLWVDIAPAEAKVVSATCPSPAAPRGSAVIAVQPGLVRAGLGELTDPALRNFATPLPSGPVPLVDVLLLYISGTARIEIAQTSPILLSFSSADIAAGTLKTARTSTAVTALITSLLDHLVLAIHIRGLGLSSEAIIGQALRSLLAPLGPALDTVLNAVLSVLGLGIGEADVRVYGIRCPEAVLVG